MNKKLLFVVNVDNFFLSHRLPVALAAQKVGFDVHVATTITDKLDVLEAHGLTVHNLGLIRSGLGLWNAIKTLLELRAIVKKIEPKIMHLVTIKPVLLGGFLARWMHVPALVSAVSGLGHVFIGGGLKSRVLRGFVRVAYRYALGHHNQVVIFQNSDDRDTLVACARLPATKIAMIRGSGVDLHQFFVEPEPSGIPVVLFPARLLKDKGILEFVAVARLLQAKGLLARFAIAGQLDAANPTSVTQAQLNAWGANGEIENWGHCLDMHRVLASANVVVLPSFREGLPKTLQEAAACGRAVVTTDVPGCRDAIEPGISGLLVPSKSVNGLSEAIEQLVIDREQRIAMGLAGRRLAEQEFDVRSVVEKHLAIYQNLIT